MYLNATENIRERYTPGVNVPEYLLTSEARKERAKKRAEKTGTIIGDISIHTLYSNGVRYANFTNNIFNPTPANLHARAATERAAAVSAPAQNTIINQTTLTEKHNALPDPFQSGNIVTGYGFTKPDASLNAKDKQKEGNTYSVARKNHRELFAERFGQNKDSIFVS